MSLCSASIVGISAWSLSVILRTAIISQSNFPSESCTSSPNGGKSVFVLIFEVMVQNVRHRLSGFSGPASRFRQLGESE